MAKILVAMSGGIDSTVTAYKLKTQNHLIEGVYMKLHGDEKYHEKNIEKVKKVADFLGINYHILDIKERFDSLVYTPFIERYKEGFTPNPCALCNRNIKFGALVDFAKELGMDRLATGHYVRVVDGFITEAVDKSKDQSYFLGAVKKESISYMLFPLGDMYKKDVKEFASKIEILKEFSSQKESSEICFVDTTYLDVLKKHMDVDVPGKVLNTKGEVVGEHLGYMHYTIGKRRGFRVKGALTPHYVLSINPEKNEITVGSKEELNIEKFEVYGLNMFIDESQMECSVKIRYRSPKTPCKVTIKDDIATIELYEPVQGLAKGQMAVFYDNERVIGSGWI